MEGSIVAFRTVICRLCAETIHVTWLPPPAALPCAKACRAGAYRHCWQRSSVSVPYLNIQFGRRSRGSACAIIMHVTAGRLIHVILPGHRVPRWHCVAGLETFDRYIWVPGILRDGLKKPFIPRPSKTDRNQTSRNHVPHKASISRTDGGKAGHTTP